jgi:hypothetical protein
MLHRCSNIQGHSRQQTVVDLFQANNFYEEKCRFYQQRLYEHHTKTISKTTDVGYAEKNAA